jgi:mannose/cellobiose epimerase-like protein (N-acyl-D-glucosamine 2-epimerase family)
MHMTEAMLAAFEATGDERFIDRAEMLARKICVHLASKANDLVWEHYHEDWSVDWDYNRSDPKNLFRPYGYLPGHFTEWSKLLLVLERHRPSEWILPRAIHLYETALLRSADLEYGGMHYSFGPDGSVFDFDKYHWVHCETLAAAACLAVRTGNSKYWQDYERLWGYSWSHLIDQKNGGWYRVLRPDGSKYDDLKSPPAKTDYHPFGACYEILRACGLLTSA